MAKEATTDVEMKEAGSPAEASSEKTEPPKKDVDVLTLEGTLHDGVFYGPI